MLKPDTLIPGLEVPNLDNLSPEDLDNAYRVFGLLQNLAGVIRTARRHRLGGQIAGAIECERNADRLYAKLPQSLRY